MEKFENKEAVPEAGNKIADIEEKVEAIIFLSK